MIRHKKALWILGIAIATMLCVGACGKGEKNAPKKDQESIVSENEEADEVKKPEKMPEPMTLENGLKCEFENGEVEITGYEGKTSEVVIPAEVEGFPVTSIGDYAFEACSGLISVEIPSGVASIGWQTFCGCSSLSSIKIPSGVTSIEPNAFAECNLSI